MANVLTELPKQMRKGGGGRAESYPFDEWLNGTPQELVAGEDYESKNATILNLIRQAAERRKVGVKTVTTENGVAVQAVEYVSPENRPKRGRPKGSTAKSNGK